VWKREKVKLYRMSTNMAKATYTQRAGSCGKRFLLLERLSPAGVDDLLFFLSLFASPATVPLSLVQYVS
jgi:hypothetical protein